MSRGELSELMAILGCDLQPLADGLAKAEVMMDEAAVKMLSSVKTIEEGLLALKTVIPAATEGLINQLLFGTGAASPQKAVNDVLAAIMLMREQKGQRTVAGGDYSGENAEIEADRMAALEFESRMDAEILAQRERFDAMMEAESIRSAEDQSRIDAEMLREREVMYRQAFASEMEYYEMRRVARLRAMQEEREQANFAFEMSRPGMGNLGMGSAATMTGAGARGTAYEIQAIEQMLGIRVPWAFSRILGSLPAIQTAMAAAFNALLIAGFIDILVIAGEKLVQLTDYVNGWGEANQKAWAKADQAAMNAIEHQIKVQKDFDIIHGMSKKEADEKEIKTSSLVISGTSERLVQLQKEKAAILARDEAFRSGLAGEGAFGIAGKLAVSATEYINDLISGRKKIEDEIDSVLGHQNQLLDERRALEVNMMQQREKHAKRMRDEVHEYPHVLPWFMGTRSSDIFTQDVMGPTLSRNWQAPQPRSGGISFNPVYAPQIHVQGTDVAHFRNKVMPQLLEDMKNNSRGATKEMARILKNHE